MAPELADKRDSSQFGRGYGFPQVFGDTSGLARGFTVGYEARPVRYASASAISLPLQEQARVLLRKLQLAGVGVDSSRPVIVAHSLEV